MKRVPSIHITEEVLIKILGELRLAPRFAYKIMEMAKAHSVSSRSIHVTNDKLLKKTEKVKLASRSNTGLFAQMLTLVRRRLHHKGIQTVKPGDKGWLDLKEVTKLATDFCNEF